MGYTHVSYARVETPGGNTTIVGIKCAPGWTETFSARYPHGIFNVDFGAGVKKELKHSPGWQDPEFRKWRKHGLPYSIYNLGSMNGKE